MLIGKQVIKLGTLAEKSKCKNYDNTSHSLYSEYIADDSLYFNITTWFFEMFWVNKKNSAVFGLTNNFLLNFFF